jgi:tetratricopeptide (TPR) repeat protein
VTKSKEHLLEQYEAHGDPETFAARLAQSPGEVREHRFLAKAFLAAHDYAQAGRVTDRGLALHPDDRMLLEVRGEVRAATGDPEGALADWRRAVDAVENMGPIYLSAFLLERLGRLEEAAAAWQSILDWCQEHDAPLTAEWPERERARLRARLAGG